MRVKGDKTAVHKYAELIHKTFRTQYQTQTFLYHYALIIKNIHKNSRTKIQTSKLQNTIKKLF